MSFSKLRNKDTIFNFIKASDDEIFFCYDGSYSVVGNYHYHQRSMQIISDLPQGKVRIVHWDSDYETISVEKLYHKNINKLGGTGTDPYQLCDYISRTNFHGKLILLTDGQIEKEQVDNLNKFLKDWHFKFVEIYIVNTGKPPNESVSCAFTRNSPHKLYSYGIDGKFIKDENNEDDDEDVVDLNTVTTEDLDILKKLKNGGIKTISDFQEAIPNLDKALLTKSLGSKGDCVLKEILVKLKKEFVAKKSDVKDDSILASFISEPITESNSNKKLEKIFNQYYNPSQANNNWDKYIDKYISWASGSLESTYDRTKVQREERADIKPITSIETATVIEEDDSTIGKITCPITLDDEVVFVIPIRDVGTTLFTNIDAVTKDELINNPLSALRNPEITSYIAKLFDSPISFEACIDLKKHGIFKLSPLTRQKLIGGICLGKHESHIAVTNSVITHSLTNGKKLGNTDLWFAVFYFMVERGDVQHLTEFLPMMREHMIFRLKHSTTYMCLSGLSTYPVYRVPLGHALYSVITSSTFIKDAKKEPLRIHLDSTEYFITLLNMINFPIPEGIEQYINRLKCLRVLLSIKKKGNIERDEIENKIDALKYNAIQIEYDSIKKFIFIDGIPSNEQIEDVKSKLPSAIKDLNISEISYINSMADKNKAESDIYIPFNQLIENYKPVETKKWLYDDKVPTSEVLICEKTCRPWYGSRHNFFWFEEANSQYGKYGENYGEKKIDYDGKPLKEEYKGLAVNKKLCDYIIDKEQYPTKDEFLFYMSKFYNNRNIKTLPICILQFVNERFHDYNSIMKTLSAKEVKKRLLKSVKICDRIEIEKSV